MLDLRKFFYNGLNEQLERINKSTFIDVIKYSAGVADGMIMTAQLFGAISFEERLRLFEQVKKAKDESLKREGLI